MPASDWGVLRGTGSTGRGSHGAGQMALESEQFLSGIQRLSGVELQSD